MDGQILECISLLDFHPILNSVFLILDSLFALMF